MTGPQDSADRPRRIAPMAGLAGATHGEAVVTALRRRNRAEIHARAAERLGRSPGALVMAAGRLGPVSPAMPGEYRAIYRDALALLQSPPEPYDQEAVRADLEDAGFVAALSQLARAMGTGMTRVDVRAMIQDLAGATAKRENGDAI